MITKEDNLELFFKTISYGVVLSALFTLYASTSISLISAIFFLIITVLAWFFEGSRWQLHEKISIAIIILAIPFFYLDWKFNISGFASRDAYTAGNLSRLILVLSSVKLLQKKSDRDWFFIYLITFFQILLAAGVGISPYFIVGLLSYLFLAFVSIILFEIRKSAKSVVEKREKQNIKTNVSSSQKTQLYRLPITALIILLAISFVAVPLFFAFPRVGGANFGGNFGGISSFTGFSDSVRLGEIGRLQQNNEVVMRVRLENKSEKDIDYFRWRGVALDTFDNQTWKKSKVQPLEQILKNDKDLFVIDNARDANNIITQTIYLEPLDTPILFTLPRPIALQGNFLNVNRDAEGAISSYRSSWGRISYKAYSEINIPNVDLLKNDNTNYPITFGRYLQLPDNLDSRISQLSEQIITQSKAKNRFEKAKAIEDYLQTNYGYTLDLKAGGAEPLSDFLFNVREGHCEYFASALAIMLRTQGIATRIVNGFQRGEYNDTADVYVVRQSDAHSWVEVYFPKEKVWVPFDATPAAGQNVQTTSNGFLGKFNNLVTALETFWIQYVVTFDNQEQRSLFRTVKNNLSDFQQNFSEWVDTLKSKILAWWSEVQGQNGIEGSLKAIGLAIGYLVLVLILIVVAIWLTRKLIRLKLWQKLRFSLRRNKNAAIIEFYQRMLNLLANKGFNREPSQTPLEFAFAVNMPEVITITEKYNQVRFGEKNLSTEEFSEIETCLNELEKKTEKQ